MFSAYDMQCDCYFHSGRNSDTYYDCLIAIWLYMIEGWEDSEIESIPIIEVLEGSEVKIIEHPEKIEG